MSTKTKWTPGPWLFRKNGRLGCDVVTLEGQNTDGDPMYWTVACPNYLRDEAEANATLIAEAPALYKELEALTGVVQSDPFLRYSEDSLYGKAIKAALAVLKKARGE